MAGVWSAGNAAGKYAGQPLKANCVSHAEGLAPLLCALSSASRVYLSQGLSTRTALFMDRHPNGAYTPPTNASVATLMRTETGRTARKARKQLWRVEPVVNT